jgi:hypothetical protein
MNPVKKRLRLGIEKYQSEITDAQLGVATKPDLVIFKNMMTELLGYDGSAVIDLKLKNPAAFFDLEIKIDNKTRFLLKIIGLKLQITPKDIKDAVIDGSGQGVNYVILTNGSDWKVIEIIFGNIVEYMHKYEFNFLKLDPSRRKNLNLLYFISVWVLGKSGNGSDNISLRRMRNAVGLLGILLPIILLLMSNLPCYDMNVQNSISYYYYTNLRDILIAVLCAVGFFLIFYKGVKNTYLSYLDNDFLLTNIAGIMAIGVAFFPTNPECCSEKIYVLIPYCDEWLGYMHFVFAVPFFIILAIISFLIFPMLQNIDLKLTKSCCNENNIYMLCGVLISVAILLIAVFMLLGIYPRSVFWLEAIALAAFGTGWLIKGRFFGSEGNWGINCYRERKYYI